MIGIRPQVRLVQRTGLALAEALRHDCAHEPLLGDGRIRRASDLLIDGIADQQLPDSIDRTRLKTAHSATALARLERHYLSHPVTGGWYDQFDREGNSLVATIPASSFYHVLCAVTEAEQVLG